MSLETEIKISIALVTRNGPERLECCLRSLREQSVQPFEVIVSDDSEQKFIATTRKVAENYGCRYIKGPHRGLYANRNHVAGACRGTHIRTMDDDHAFPPGHFELCLKAVRLDPSAVWTTGEIGFVDGKFFDRVETASQLHPSGMGTAPDNPDDNWTIADGSTIYPASVFQKGLRMVEDHGYGSNYLEFGAYLRRHGYHSRCIKGAVVEHYATQDTILRMNTYRRPQAASSLFASLSYNLFFKRSIPRAISYSAKILWKSRFDPVLLVELPQIMAAVKKRWKQAPQKG